jgi:cell wall-associated NlpC family hydrolase
LRIRCQFYLYNITIVQSDKVDKNKSDKVIVSQNRGKLSASKVKVQKKQATVLKSKKTSAADKVRKRVVKYAISKEKLPYILGGTDLSEGVDTSGFIQSVYKKFHYDIARTSMEQEAACKKVSLDSLKPGDLIFYADHDNKVNHVSIFIGCNKVIHAKNRRVGVIIEDMNYRKPYTAGRVISD